MKEEGTEQEIPDWKTLNITSREVIVLSTQRHHLIFLLNSRMQNNFHKLNQQTWTATASQDWNFPPLLTRKIIKWPQLPALKKMSMLWSLYIFSKTRWMFKSTVKNAAADHDVHMSLFLWVIFHTLTNISHDSWMRTWYPEITQAVFLIVFFIYRDCTLFVPVPPSPSLIISFIIFAFVFISYF